MCLNLVLSVHVGKHAEQQEFYDALYSVTDDPEVVLREVARGVEQHGATGVLDPAVMATQNIGVKP